MKFSLPHLSFECESDIKLTTFEDDFKREAAFAQQALTAVAKARRLIIAAKIPFTRPAGYFCEMLKTDEHMARISNKIDEQKEADKAAELARKQRHNRKYGKKMQVAREQEKASIVSEDKKKLNLLRKRKPVKNEDEFGIQVEDIPDFGDQKSKARKVGAGGKRVKAVSQKRQARNEQYGFGGRKKGEKRNDKNSAAVDDFNPRKNREAFKGMEGKGGKRFGSGKKQATRPGKQRRQQMRSKTSSTGKR